MTRRIVSSAFALVLATAPAIAQTANSSPATGSGTAGGNVSRTAPSGGTAKPDAGTPQIGPETPVEKKADEDSKKVTGICKGC